MYVQPILLLVKGLRLLFCGWTVSVLRLRNCESFCCEVSLAVWVGWCFYCVMNGDEWRQRLIEVWVNADWLFSWERSKSLRGNLLLFTTDLHFGWLCYCLGWPNCLKTFTQRYFFYVAPLQTNTATTCATSYRQNMLWHEAAAAAGKFFSNPDRLNSHV